MSNARETTLAALLQVDVNAGYSNLVLDKALRTANLSQRDAGLASAIFYGVLERRLTLDNLLAQFCKQPLEKLTPEILEILRMASFQIFYLEKIPPSAAVNEAVELAKRHKGKAAGFVNGVLRNLLRNRQNVKLPSLQAQTPRELSIAYSCPEWLIALWQAAYGREHLLGLLGSLQHRAPLYARVNTTKITVPALIDRLAEEGVAAKPVSCLAGAIELAQTGAVAQLNTYTQGLFHVQDLSSQLCCALLAPQPGETILDVCAAPGGKTFTIAEHMENRGTVLAFDQYKGKVGLIKQGAQRLGLSVIQAEMRDARAPKHPLPPADRVLCDVPCAGLGIIRRKPEIRYKPKQELDALPALQYEILTQTAQLVRSGGTLAYATCSLNPAENAQVAERFLQSHPQFVPKPLALPAGIRQIVDQAANQITLLPHIHGTDGFFIALFERK